MKRATRDVLNCKTAASVASLAAMAAVPASGATKNVSDPEGDQFTVGYDVRSVRYTNEPDAVTSAVWLARLRTYARVDFQVASRDGNSEIYGAVVQRRDGRTRAQLWHYAVEGPGQKVDCDLSARWSAGKRRVAVEVPASCLDFELAQVNMSTYVSKKGAKTWMTCPRRV